MSEHTNELTPQQREDFRIRLEAMGSRLRTQIADAEQELHSPEAISNAEDSQGDDGSLLFAHEQALDLIARTRIELTQVERALARIAAGTYGISEVSGLPIPIERLEVLPFATTLVGEKLPNDR
jgi:RNA polymerase-binding transcription factor DksA